MLTIGKPPFDGKNDREVIKKVRNVIEADSYEHFYCSEFENLKNDTLKEMIKELLHPNYHRRPSADEVLDKYNAWFKLFNEDVDFEIAV